VGTVVATVAGAEHAAKANDASQANDSDDLAADGNGNNDFMNGLTGKGILRITEYPLALHEFPAGFALPLPGDMEVHDGRLQCPH
jgi:hypothetical protein